MAKVRKPPKHERRRQKDAARERRKLQRATRDAAILAKRSDDERREHMRALDDRSPLKPGAHDLVVADVPAMRREFERQGRR